MGPPSLTICPWWERERRGPVAAACDAATSWRSARRRKSLRHSTNAAASTGCRSWRRCSPTSGAASRSRQGSSAPATPLTKGAGFDGFPTPSCSTTCAATALATTAATHCAASTGRRPGFAARWIRRRRRPIPMRRQAGGARASKQRTLGGRRERVPLPGNGVRPCIGRARLVGRQVLRPGGSCGNVPLGRFLAVSTRIVVEEIRRRLGLWSYPVKSMGPRRPRGTQLDLQAGDTVRVRSAAEISETLDASLEDPRALVRPGDAPLLRQHAQGGPPRQPVHRRGIGADDRAEDRRRDPRRLPLQGLRERGPVVLPTRDLLVVARRLARSVPRRETEMATCRLCGSELRETLVDLGSSPPCESFLRADQLNEAEPFYRCMSGSAGTACSLSSRSTWPPRTSSRTTRTSRLYSTPWVEHARRYTEKMVELFGLDPRASSSSSHRNDGYLLQHFVERGVPASASTLRRTSPRRPRRGASRPSWRSSTRPLAETLVAERGKADSSSRTTCSHRCRG